MRTTLLLSLLWSLLAGASAWAGCPDLPVVRDITSDRIYTDSKGSIPDKAVIKANHQENQPLIESLHRFVQIEDDAFSGDRKALHCSVAILTKWAEGGELQGAMSSREAITDRETDIVALGVAYYKIANKIDPADRKAIEPWLRELAYTEMSVAQGYKRVANQSYWGGLAALAIGYAADDTTLQAFGRSEYAAGLNEITDDGYLPAESNRGARALIYHDRAMDGLVMMAEIAARQGEDWYSLNNGALHRLALGIAKAHQNPRAFAQKLGLASVEIQPDDVNQAWFTLYNARFPHRLPFTPPGHFVNKDLGGDMDALAKAWSKKAS